MQRVRFGMEADALLFGNSRLAACLEPSWRIVPDFLTDRIPSRREPDAALGTRCMDPLGRRLFDGIDLK